MANYYGRLGRDAKLLLAYEAVNGPISGVYATLAEIYLAKMGLGPVEIAALGSAESAAHLLLLVPSGILTDLLGARALLVLGAILAALSNLIFVLSSSFTTLLASYILSGIGWGVSYPAYASLLTSATEPERRHVTFSVVAATRSLTSMLGSAAAMAPYLLRRAGLAGELESYRLVFAATLVLSIPPIVLAHMVRAGGGEPGFRLSRVRGLKNLRTLVLVNALVGAGAGMAVHVFNIWFYFRFGSGEEWLSPLYTVQNLLMALLTLAMPRLSDRLGIVKSLVLTQGSSITLLALTPLLPTPGLVSIVWTARTLLMNMGNPVMESLQMSLVPRSIRGTAGGILTLAWNLPPVFTRVLGGYMVSRGMFDIPFYACSCLYAAATTLLYASFSHVKKLGDAGSRTMA